MPKKLSRQERKREQEKNKHKHVPPQHLLQQGRQKLEDGDPRQALDYFKQVQGAVEAQGLGPLPGLDFLFFCAYAQRAEQLAAKGMVREAAAVRNMADGQGTSIDPSALSADDFLQYIRHLEPAQAIPIYARSVGQRESSAQVEQALADQMVVHRCWETLSCLDQDHSLRRDAEIVKPAVATMDEGAWEQAGAALVGISRRSPYAPWRIFCRAMACFDAQDDSGLRQALDLLPQHFILSQTVDELWSVCSPERSRKGKVLSAPVQQVLGTGGVDREQLARALLAALHQDPPHWREVERLLPPLAKAIHPEEPLAACVALLEIIGVGARQNRWPLSNILAMQRLLPRDLAQAVAARIELVNQATSHSVWNVAPAVAYLAHLNVEFPEARQQTLARAHILEFLARSGHNGGACPNCVGTQVIQSLWGLMGEHSGDPHLVYADLMLASLELDPDNREGYRFLLELLRGDTSARPRMERVLTEMVHRFPDDPDPCLELALFQYSRNGYRKAEAALEEARKRAPHDERILDRQAVGCVKASDQGRNRRSYVLAQRDLERAEELGRRRLVPVLLVKRLGLKLMSAGSGATAEVGRELDALPPGEQLRALALLILDLGAVKNVDQRIMSRLKRMLDRKRGLLDRLSGGEVVSLMSPLDDEFRLVFPSLDVAPVLADWGARLLALVEGDDLTAAYDILVACGYRAVVQSDITRRLAGRGCPRGASTSDQDALLRLYQAVILHSQGAIYGSHGFEAVVAAAGPALKEQLRAAAARLAPYTAGPLREALQQFEFSILDSPFALLGGIPPEIHAAIGEIIEEKGPQAIEELIGELSGLLDDDEIGPFDEDDEDDYLDELQELEQLLDKSQVRGASMPDLKDFVAWFRSDPKRRRELDRFAREFEDRYNEMSRELRILAFPKRKAAARRAR